jgi:hypothetical protein
MEDFNFSLVGLGVPLSLSSLGLSILNRSERKLSILDINYRLAMDWVMLQVH